MSQFYVYTFAKRLNYLLTVFSIRPDKAVVKVHNIRIACKSRLNSKTFRLLTIEEYLLISLIYLALALCQIYYRKKRFVRNVIYYKFVYLLKRYKKKIVESA